MARSAIVGQIKMKDLFTFCKCDPYSQNFNEGEAALDAGHVLMVGQTASDDDSVINIYGLVLPTSGLTSAPHEVKGTITKEEKVDKKGDRIIVQLHLEQFTCSCKAGADEQCKHIVAVLLYLYKCDDIFSLEKVSCTDVKRLRKQKKGMASEIYEAKPIDTFCCVSSVQEQRDEYQKIINENPEILQELKKLYVEACISKFGRP